MNDNFEQLKQINDSHRLLQALKDARAKLELSTRYKTEEIAIIGLSCRFPGGAINPDGFWEVLSNEIDAIQEIPKERWNIDDFYHEIPGTPGKMYTKSGGFLQQVDLFDPQFFGISPREAESLDPQQRLLLEVTWEALENSGIATDTLIGSRTGTFIGIGQNDYAQLGINSGENQKIRAYDGTGNGFCFASGRLSYVLGLQGPNMAIDTACSSSLVSVHLACQSLRMQECSLAIAGGVHLILSPEVTLFLSDAKALSPDGRCKTFDALADGYGRGEGCGIVILKRLSDALNDGDNILALIKGSAVNHDGASSGLTVPNKKAQEDLINQALINARVEASQVSYVETHGTGTPLGDPIEIRALNAVFGKGRTTNNPLLIGSVKTNIGHLEAASGIAGLIKVVLSMQHQEIPSHLNFHQPSSYINWDEIPIKVTAQSVPWKHLLQTQIAGISSFGISGTNAHMILEAAPQSNSLSAECLLPFNLLTLSAKTDIALKQLANNYFQYFSKNQSLLISDICSSTNTGRSHFDYRFSLVISSFGDLQSQLANFLTQQSDLTEDKCFKIKRPDQNKIVFLFTDQNLGHFNMGKELYETQPVFRRSVINCADILTHYLDEPLLEFLFSDKQQEYPLNRAIYNQSALFVLEYALFQLWISWGIKPYTLMGYGLGEYVAACVSEVFSLEDALKLVLERSNLMDNVLENTVDINPGNRLDNFREIANQIKYSTPKIRMISSLGSRSHIDTPDFWCTHLLEPAKFTDAISTIEKEGCEIFLEIGPNSSLIEAIKEHFVLSKSVTPIYLSSLKQHQSNWLSMIQSLGSLYNRGVSVTWSEFNNNHDCQRQHIQLPNHPFDRQHYWVKRLSNSNLDHHSKLQPLRLHELLDKKIDSPLVKEILFETSLGIAHPAFIADHRICGKVVVPGAFYISLLLEAVTNHFQYKKIVLEELLFSKALVILDDNICKLHLAIIPENLSEASFKVASLDKNSTSLVIHSTGKINLLCENLANEVVLKPVSLARVKSRCQAKLVGTDIFSALQKRQVILGESFQWIEAVWKGADELLCQMQIPESLSEIGNYQLHPSLIDSCFQFLISALPIDDTSTFVPFGIEKFRFIKGANNSQLLCYAKLRGEKAEGFDQIWDIQLMNSSEELLAEIIGFRGKKVNPQILVEDTKNGASDLYQINWEEAPHHQKVEDVQKCDSRRWVCFADNKGIGLKLSKMLKERGDSCILIFQGSHYEKISDHECYIDPENQLDYQNIFQDIIFSPSTSVGIIHLWSLNDDFKNGIEINASSLKRTQLFGCGSVMYLLQSLAKNGGIELSRIWLITKESQSVSGTESILQIHQASLWGLGRVITVEYPSLQCVNIDLDFKDEEEQVRSLFKDIFLPVSENQIAYRHEIRYVARLKPYQAYNNDKHLSIVEKGTYVITGGLGALGIEVAKSIVKDGAKYIVLISRSKPSDKVQKIIEEIKELGVQVLVKQSDICKEEDLKSVLYDIQQSFPPIKGVIHGAGVLDDGTLLDQNLMRFEKVMDPKILGSWNLHILTQNLDLDFFICFSSAASLLGSSGQSSYAAANAFMDALMHHRHRLGLPGMSINWGPWELGMSGLLNHHYKSRLFSQGINTISLEKGLQALRYLIGKKITQVGFFFVDWPVFTEHFSLPVTRLFSQVPLTNENLAHRKPQNNQKIDGKESLISYVKLTIFKVLGLDISQLDLQQPLHTMGLDSLMSMELHTNFKNELGVEIPTSKFNDNVTTGDLIRMIEEAFFLENSPLVVFHENDKKIPKENTQHKYNTNDLLMNIDELTEKEIDSLLESLSLIEE